ncbi:hypothetical protein ACQP2U_23380 [Nocardia sp. CA-084685]|uniref:hypothetical protein n=1 Tax=Nocardia sp. CA-084685 TaxID=3239970 RepID=UPI003D9902A8
MSIFDFGGGQRATDNARGNRKLLRRRRCTVTDASEIWRDGTSLAGMPVGRILLRRCRVRLSRSLWLRRTAWFLLITFALFVFPGVLGAFATAQTSTATPGASANSALSWMDVKDSSGVKVSDYLFATDSGGPLAPKHTILWAVIGLEFIGYKIIVTTAIWWIGYALSFEWLNIFASALRGVADALTGQIATPLVLVTAASIGAFFVAWFVVRGYHAKATMQVVTMLAVAMLGPVFLADPLADVLSSDGLLAQGRNLGISVSAGLNGNNNPNPTRLVATMQSDLADNFARRPVQVWNFGHVVDERPSCRAAWSAGVQSGDDDTVQKGMKTCGDAAAYATAQSPSMDQVGTGLMLLICGGILLVFGGILGGMVFKAALDTMYHGVRSMFGFAAGGLIYGPTQTSLVRDLVDSFISAARMTTYTVFLGVYMLFLGNLFAQAHGQSMTVIVIAGAVEIAAISQLRKLRRSLSNGGDFIANRFALAVQGSGGPGAGNGSGGARALGMGNVGVSRSASGGMITTLAALNTMNTSPAMAWAALGTKNPLDPLARGRKLVDKVNRDIAQKRRDYYNNQHSARTNHRLKAVMRANAVGGINTELGLAAAIDGLGDNRIPNSILIGTLVDAGARDHLSIQNGLRATARMNSSMDKSPYGFTPLQKALAAARAVENTVGDEAERAFAAQAVIAANNFAGAVGQPELGAPINHPFVKTVRDNWDSEARLRAAITPDQWNNVGRDTRWFIGDELAQELQAAARAYYDTPTDENRILLRTWSNRVANLDHMAPDDGLDPFNP